MDDLSKSSNESLLVFYENVRRQVDADIKSGGRYRFIGESVKQYADGTWRRNGPAAIAVYANRLAERTIDLARLRECDLPAGYLRYRFPTFDCSGHDSSFSNSLESDPGTLIWML
ncbi:MAG TPA: hypothetical protein VK555_09615 [Terriglobales bacterium]|nr:hypothetical protein [Terriglobales bacterium]